MREAVNEALKAAMKSRDQAATGTVRLISAAIKERDIARAIAETDATPPPTWAG